MTRGRFVNRPYVFYKFVLKARVKQGDLCLYYFKESTYTLNNFNAVSFLKCTAWFTFQNKYAIMNERR